MKKFAFASTAALALALAGLGMSTNADARGASGSHGLIPGNQISLHSGKGNALPSGTYSRNVGLHGNQFRYINCNEYQHVVYTSESEWHVEGNNCDQTK